MHRGADPGKDEPNRRFDGRITVSGFSSTVLGRAVTADLKIFAKGELFGLIYKRRGDSASAARTAKVHTRLLRRAGLDVAAPMREGRWTLLRPGNGPRKRTVSRVYKKSVPRAGRDPVVRNLEAGIDAYIKGLRRKGRLAADERTGWSVYDFTTGKKLVTHKESLMY